MSLWYKWLGRRKCSGFERKVYAASLNAAVYAIWFTRNDAVWNAKVNTPICVFERIKRDVICKINAHIPERMSSVDRAWWDSLCNIV